jgi:hypothetical protein
VRRNRGGAIEKFEYTGSGTNTAHDGRLLGGNLERELNEAWTHKERARERRFRQRSLGQKEDTHASIESPTKAGVQGGPRGTGEHVPLPTYAVYSNRLVSSPTVI